MNLKEEFLRALDAGEGHDALLVLVRRHQIEGVTPQQTYEILEEIWAECGFDDREKDTSLRDELEYVMENLWYQGSP